MPEWGNEGQPPPPTDRENEELAANNEASRALELELEGLCKKAYEEKERAIMKPFVDAAIEDKKKIATLEAENLRLQTIVMEMSKGEEEWLHWKAEVARLQSRPLAEHPLIKKVCEKFPGGWRLVFNLFGDGEFQATLPNDGSFWKIGKTPEEALEKLAKEMSQ